MLAETAVVVPLAGQPRSEARSGGRLLSLPDLLALPPPEWLIDGLLPACGFTVLFGPPGSGKSFVALSWALAVAAGRPWISHPTRPGPVLYIVAEGSAGMGSRARAALHVENYPEDLPITFYPDAVDLSEVGSVQALLSELRTAGIGSLRLVIIDTLARCFGGGDENSARDMNRFVQGATLLAKETGAAVLVIHHTGKDEGRGARGSNSLKAAADTEISCGGEYPFVRLTCEKQKDAEPFDELELVLRQVKIGNDRTSCVMRLKTAEELLKLPPSSVLGKRARNKSSPKKEAELEQMVAVIPAEGLHHQEWRSRYCQETGQSPSTFDRNLRVARDTGRVFRPGTGKDTRYFLADAGADHAQ